MISLDIPNLLNVAENAGLAIMEVYEHPIEVINKADKSPLTLADQHSNKLIVDALHTYYPHIPIISEEAKLMPWEQRKSWESCWLVDPLDGTKEFIKKNGEFTVNIALIEGHAPSFGVIFIPASKTFYYGGKAYGAWKKMGKGDAKPIKVAPDANHILRIAGSRSHTSEQMDNYLAMKRKNYEQVSFHSAGSSLKFCLVADGSVHEYPRFGPTMEWDTAAGQAVVEGAGGSVLIMETNTLLTYNRKDLLNPPFIAYNHIYPK